MTRDLQGQGGGGSAHSCPRCGVFFGTYIAGDAAVALRCAECGYTIEPHSHSTAPLPAALDSGLRYWVDRMRPVEPASVPADPAERTLLSLQSRWAHAECSCEQVAAEAIAVIRQLTLDASAERARLSTQVAALSALAETILRPPPEIQEVYDLQMRLVPHCDELDRVLGSDDRSLLNYTLGAVHGMHLRIQKLESGQGPADDGGPDMKPAPRDLNGEIIEWVRSCKGEPTLHILAALMGNAVNLARALDFSLARFISGIEMHWGLFSAAAARKQGEASGAPSVSALLRALQGKSQ